MFTHEVVWHVCNWKWVLQLQIKISSTQSSVGCVMNNQQTEVARQLYMQRDTVCFTCPHIHGQLVSQLSGFQIYFFQQDFCQFHAQIPQPQDYSTNCTTFINLQPKAVVSLEQPIEMKLLKQTRKPHSQHRTRN